MCCVTQNHLFPLLYRFLQVHVDLRNQLGAVRGGLSEYRAVVDELRTRLRRLPKDVTTTAQALEAGFISKQTWYSRYGSAQNKQQTNGDDTEQAQAAEMPS